MVTASAVNSSLSSSTEATTIYYRDYIIRLDDLAAVNASVCNLLRDNFVENPDNETHCNWAWDQVSCWPPTPAGSTTKQRCPRGKGVDPANFAEKRCDTTGKWAAKWPNGTNQTASGWTNYIGCFYPEVRRLLEQLYAGSEETAKLKMAIAARTRKIEFVGLLVSLAALLASLVIFNKFRSLRNNRTRIHKNLFVAMVIQVLIRLTLYTDQALLKPDGKYSLLRLPNGIENTPLLCEATYILLEYARTAMFMWMFVEGLYLHNMVTVTVFQDKVYTWLYTLLGWGAPVVLTAVWAVATAMYYGADTRCWFAYNLTGYFWILEGPRIGVVSLNALFLLNIIRVLIVKLRQSHTSEIEQVRKAVRAAIVLLPLLGITNLTNMTLSPVDGTAWEFALWSYATYFLTSFQGFFIAILYCFINGEVRIAVAKSISNYWSLRSRHFHARRHSALPGIYVTSTAPSIGVASESPTTPAPNDREKSTAAWIYICCQGGVRSNTSQCPPPELSRSGEYGGKIPLGIREPTQC